MAKGKKGRRRGLIPKTMGGVVSLAFKILGTVVALSPSFRGAGDAISGKVDPQVGVYEILYDYTGVNVPGRSFNGQQTVVGIGTIAGGVIIAKLGSFFGRMLH